MKSDIPVGGLPNIGPVLAGDLCWNMLYALEGAVRRRHSLTAMGDSLAGGRPEKLRSV